MLTFKIIQLQSSFLTTFLIHFPNNHNFMIYDDPSWYDKYIAWCILQKLKSEK